MDWRVVLGVVILLYVALNAFFIIRYTLTKKKSRQRIAKIDDAMAELQKDLEEIRQDFL
jgi:DNA-binding transcriptional regulator GbsR (MarR family)